MQTESLSLAARGASNKEIAFKRHITEVTVKSHFVHIFNKLNVTNRIAAMAMALGKR